MLKIITNVRLGAVDNYLRIPNHYPNFSRCYSKGRRSKSDRNVSVKTFGTPAKTSIPPKASTPSKTSTPHKISTPPIISTPPKTSTPPKSSTKAKTSTPPKTGPKNVFNRLKSLIFGIPSAPCVKGKTMDNSKCLIEDFYGNPLNLPRCIVPPMQDTLTRLLRSVQPFLSECDFYKTQKHCCNFEKQGGTKLNQALIKFAASREDWLDHLWKKYGYLLIRDPILIHRNPTINFHKMDVDGLCGQMQLAARLTVLCLNFQKMAYQNKLPPEKGRCGEYEMESYKKIWGACRTVGEKIDTLDYCPKSKHIILVIKNNYFKIPVYGCEPEQSLSENDLLNQFNVCLEQIHEAVPVGILTADHRDCWYKNNQLLHKDRNSMVAIKEIRDALFMICVDKKMPGQKDKYDMVTQGHQMLHGGGSEGNTCNRWFDKTLQIIIGPTGMVGFNYEHTSVDGLSYTLLADYLMQYSGKDCKLDVPDACSFASPNRLEFCCSKELLDAIECSKKNVDCSIADYHHEILDFKGYGKEAIEKANFSPDSLIQIAIQYAYFKLQNHPAGQSETGTTRIFNYGRTEPIRSCCIEVIRFCTAMICSDNIRLHTDLLRKATEAHNCLVDEAARGLGIDRHFMALRAMSIDHNISLPELYKDPGFIKSGYFRLSTNNLRSKFKVFGVHGPSVPDGYTVCYNPRADDIIIGISSWKSTTGENLTKYKDMLEKCLMEFKKLIECGPSKPKN